MSKFIPQSQPGTDIDSDTDSEADKIALLATIPLRAIKKAPAMLRKVPEVTVYFWIVKLLTTAMGEATSDYLVNQFSPVHAVALGALGLAVALIIQFSVRRYVAWIYWLTAIMVAIFGTMAADVLHVGLHIPYAFSATGFAVALIVIFAVWYISEKTLSIHSIYTRRRELFYWATVMATFALGTAVGDLTATTMGLGFFASGVMFAVFIALPALAYKLLRLNAIVAFWLAYILTRPLGASFADWMVKPHASGALGLNGGLVCLVFTLLIAGFVGYLTVTRKDVQREQ